MSIHPTAIIEDNVEIGYNTTIGEFTIIRSGARIGKDNVIGSHVEIKGDTTIGDGNKIYKGACLGDVPQDYKYKDSIKSGLIVGNNNLIREFVTFHRGSVDDSYTKVGDNNFFMVNSHVGHDTIVHNNVIMTNNSVLAGWTEVENNVIMSAYAGVHQNCRIGRYAFISAHARVIQDIPPFCLVSMPQAKVYGLNAVGMRRAGFSPEQKSSIKEAFNIIYRKKLSTKAIIEELEKLPQSEEIETFITFIKNAKRGILTKLSRERE